jgi:hypothetical protein
MDDEKDTLEAFVACGGNPDGSGSVAREQLTRIIKNDFCLDIDVDEFIDTYLKTHDKRSEVSYHDFKLLLNLSPE